MRWKLPLVIPAVVVAFLLWLVLAGTQPPAPVVEAVSRREAVDLLQPLIADLEIEITEPQRRLVGAECLRIQATILEHDRNRLPDLQAKYQGFLARAGGYVWGLTDQLNAFANDGSSLNLAMVELRRFHLRLDEQFADYNRSLEVAVAVNCIAYPEHFVVGLHQVRANYQQLSITAVELANFIDNGLPEAFIDTECHLFDIDDPNCH